MKIKLDKGENLIVELPSGTEIQIQVNHSGKIEYVYTSTPDDKGKQHYLWERDRTLEGLAELSRK